MAVRCVYKVNLDTGITVDRWTTEKYRSCPDRDKTVFLELRKAKAAFNAASKAEIVRLRSLRKTVLSNKTMQSMIDHSNTWL